MEKATSSEEVATWGANSWPMLDGDGLYLGPLRKDCSCQVTRTLARASNEEGFRTTGTDEYPQALDEAIAAAIIADHASQLCRLPKVGEKGRQSERKRRETNAEKTCEEVVDSQESVDEKARW